MWLTKNWDTDNMVTKDYEIGIWKKRFIAAGNRVGIFAMTCFGGWAIIRYAGFIKSIRLKPLTTGEVAMSIDIRRRHPFSETHYMVMPGQLSMPGGWRTRITLGKGRQSKVPSRSLSFLQDFIFMQGVVSPIRMTDVESNGKARGMLDPRGIKLSEKDWAGLTRESFI
ncbi:uncharacterized protein AB675_9347 [Cyphellophora attinorum]|uniref:Transmembrane protein n=1 Tax=Cyphellophora attinorum TaxID=1664694 RepID=A0A0N0NNG1_9EURO|nr:uncharacterized protein AB675_9347 [Phialophora attinorum]KPI41488.1 hypothetical protein AB675_9347 [Phialophora attinorum]